jgi:Protein of unknown function (DUF3224)
MKSKSFSIVAPAVAALIFSVHRGVAQSAAPAPVPLQKENSLTHHASGPFDVKLASIKSDTIDSSIGAMSIDKQYHGALDGTSKGVMLAVSTALKGSAGYVAMEKVTGSLDGRKGTFALQHTATMDRSAPSLSIMVVPDSGTAELTGLTGKMNIVIAEGGKHSYEFDYTLAPTQ